MSIDEGFKQFATETQARYIDAVIEHGSNRKAAKALDVHPSSVDAAIQSVKRKAALQGYSPQHDMTRTAPEPFIVRGVSTYYDEDGKPRGQWVKTKLDDVKHEAMLRAVVDGMKEEIPRAEPVSPPKQTFEHLLNCYVITDFHLGMKSWGEETGADWDTSIAADMIVAWFAQAIAQSPNSKEAVFAQLGDFMHWDGLDAVTPTSGHLLDADSRFQKLIRSTISVIRRITAMLLQKHEHVHLLMAEGNHDIASSAWLREMFYVLYEDEPRITVETSPDPYYCVEFGKTSLFFHHGHKRKFETLETVFIAKFREVFGRTIHSYAHTGHLHHDLVKETNTMKLEQHRTLAAPDSHASRGGWMSGRDAKVITYHKVRGEVSRIIINSDMLEEAA